MTDAMVNLLEDKKLIRLLAGFNLTPSQITSLLGLKYHNVYNIMRRNEPITDVFSYEEAMELAEQFRLVHENEMDEE